MGYTTGACATAAAAAAFEALLSGRFPDPVTITLPRGERPEFPLVHAERSDDAATAGVVKDAGDDPDVTHGARILATVRACEPGSGVVFRAGEGVGTVSLPGLALGIGEPAINPVPREMMRKAVAEIASRHEARADLEITISIPGGGELARRTLNPRLGIIGGLSVLGTTGVVIPYSCAAWIDAIRCGIDVARACAHTHLAVATGRTSERAAKRLFKLDDTALIEMGGFVGGTLEYLRDHPLPRITLAGGFAKISKLAAGHLDLRCARSKVEMPVLAKELEALGAPPELISAAAGAASAGEVLQLAAKLGLPLADAVAARARGVAREVLSATRGKEKMEVDVVIFDRNGCPIGRAGGAEGTLPGR